MKERLGIEEFRKFVGSRVRHFREEKGLTQMDLAFMSALDRSYIQHIEHGRQSISFFNIWKIAQCLNRPLSDFAPSFEEEEKAMNEES